MAVPRHADPRGINDQERRLVELEDSVRVRYLTSPTFHARVHAGAQVLQELHPDMDPQEAQRTVLLVLAAMDQQEAQRTVLAVLAAGEFA